MHRRGCTLAACLDEGHVELPRQAERGASGDQRKHEEACVDLPGIEHFAGGGRGGGIAKQQDQREPGDRQQRDQLDHRFERDGQDQPGIVARAVGAARPEQDREQRHQPGDDEDDLVERDAVGQPGIEHQQRIADRAELQRHVRERTDRRDDRHQRRDARALAVAGGEEVGDRGRVLRLGLREDPPDQPEAEREDEDRAEIDRQEIEPGARRGPDPAEKGPAGAIDRQRQAVDRAEIARIGAA